MIEVQDIFEQYSEGYRQNHTLSMMQHKTINAILNCRTARLVGHTDYCPKCGYQRPSYNSCRNRHCPKCQMLSNERWIDAQKGDLLNVGYFYVVFTVPKELNQWIYRNQQDCYNLLFRCTAETMQELSLPTKSISVPPPATPQSSTHGDKISASTRIFTAFLRVAASRSWQMASVSKKSSSYR